MSLSFYFTPQDHRKALTGKHKKLKWIFSIVFQKKLSNLADFAEAESCIQNVKIKRMWWECGGAILTQG
jgi:hypothetical protein